MALTLTLSRKLEPLNTASARHLTQYLDRVDSADIVFTHTVAPADSQLVAGKTSKMN